MRLRLGLARAVGALSTWTLKTVFKRPAANFPGKAGLYLDPNLIADLRSRLGEGSIVVVGTNGKTTVTNLIADSFEAAGKTVACNRTGANLDSGIATALLHAKRADWGIFESDELWLAKVVPQLKPDYVVLLNLFRDQLDRMGEIEHLQASISNALGASPETKLIYNVDDPLCHAVAVGVSNECIPFGIDEDLSLPQNTVADSGMCQRCDSMLDYDWRQYGQLGSYQCPNCGFGRKAPSYAAVDVTVAASRPSFTVRNGLRSFRVDLPFSQTYMLYNSLAVYVAADCGGISSKSVETALESFSPQNGRLQRYEIGSSHVLLNLAKNPTGFNQNLRIVENDPGPKAVAFYINDNEADGHDVSWLWDIDFQELASVSDLLVYAGGIRRNDMQVRLKYAGIDAQLVDGARDFLVKARALSANATLYLIANYTALPEVKAELDRLQELGGKPGDGLEASAAQNYAPSLDGPEDKPAARSGKSVKIPLESESPYAAGERFTIVHLYPELLNLYGDGGNVIVLAERARKRGLTVEVLRLSQGQDIDFKSADVIFLGGGPDREQRLASMRLLDQAEALRSYVEDNGVLLAICGGYQILGREWLLGNEIVAGLGIADIATGRAHGGSHNRLVGNIVLESPLADLPVVGYENHAGRTFLGKDCQPFGHVIGKQGKGNNDVDGADGVLYRNVLGTYLHGPLLAKNPEIADWLIERALMRRAAKTGKAPMALMPLDDACERSANEFMCAKLGVKA